MGLKREDLETLRKELVDERERLQSQLAYVEGQVVRHSLRDSSGGAGMPLHPADAGTDHAEREKTVQLNATERRRLASIDEALARIERGKYGACEQCGGAISIGRLRALPDATLCIDCKEKEERSARKGGS